MTKVRAAVDTTFRSLRFRNFRLFFAGQLISQIGTWLTQIALTLLVLHLTKSGIAIGLLTACSFGPVLLLGPYGGLLADRSDKRRLLLLTQTLQMAQSFSLAVLAFLPHPPLVAFYLAALAGGVILAFDNPARRSFVTEMVPAEYVPNAVTLNSALMTTSRVFGPALGGLLVVTAGYAWAFTIDGISYLAVLAGLWLMRTSELHVAPRTARSRGQVREGLRYVRTVRDLWVPLMMATIIGVLTYNFGVVLPLVATHTFHGGDGTYTLLQALLGLGSVTAALVASHRQNMRVETVVKAAFGYGVAMFAFAAAPNLWTAVPIVLAVGFANVAFMTSSTALVQVQADPSMRGRVLALQTMVILGTTPIGGPLVGAICDALGARAGLVVGGLGALGAAVWGHVVISRGAPEREQLVAAVAGR